VPFFSIVCYLIGSYITPLFARSALQRMKRSSIFILHTQQLSVETISLKRLFFTANIPNTYIAILNSNLPWHVDENIFKASIDILKKRLID
jgi:hypothetical protein